MHRSLELRSLELRSLELRSLFCISDLVIFQALILKQLIDIGYLVCTTPHRACTNHFETAQVFTTWSEKLFGLL